MKGKIPSILLFLSLLIVFIGRIIIGFSRYYDPDEFAHLHWAYLIANGQLPYRDFFFYITPLFQWILAPIFFLPQSSQSLFIARLISFLLYLLCSYLVFILAKRATRSTPAALLGTLVFTIFPMTIDKTIDVRPDTIMTLFLLVSVVLLTSSKRISAFHSFAAGIFFGLSMLTLIKIVYAVPAILFLVLTTDTRTRFKTLFYGIVGMALPFICLIGWYKAEGLLPFAWNAFTNDQFAVNYGKQSFSILKTLSPWPLVYVANGGPSIPWYTSSVLWILTIPGLIALCIQNVRIGGFLTLFVLSAAAFLIAFPVPYVQYFVPVSVATGIACGWFVWRIASVIGKRMPLVMLIILALSSSMLLWSFWVQFNDRSGSRIMLDEQIRVIDDLLEVTKPNETVYDMTGSYVFRPDGYFLCCHPYAEFVDRLAIVPSTLRGSLVQHNTKFLVMDQKAYVFWLPKPEDLSFMLSHYVDSPYKKIYVAGVKYSCDATGCMQVDFNGNPVGNGQTKTLAITFEEKYTLTTSPPNGSVIIDNRFVQDGETLNLKAKTYALLVSQNLTGFTLRLAR